MDSRARTSATARLLLLLLPALLVLGVIGSTTGAVGVAAGASCSDVRVLFGRGRDEPPGAGRVGTAFVNALEPMLKGRSMSVYALDYPAVGVGDYGIGANDMSRQLQDDAAACPQTKFVVGGYSLGAAATDLVLGVGVLPGFGFNQPIPDEVGARIAAVATFGNAADKFAGPLNVISPVYGSRAIDLCNDGDPICSNGNDRAAHSLYEQTALPAQAAAFVAGLV